MRKVACILLFSAASGAWAAEAPLAQFGWFADVVGSCWAGTFPDGKTQHTHCYTEQFGRFIRGTSVLSIGFQGDSLFAWNGAERRIDYYIWGSDGSHSRQEASYDGERLVFPIRSRKDPAKIAFRSAWKRIDANSFEVSREVPDGEGWKTELTVLYRRQAPK